MTEEMKDIAKFVKVTLILTLFLGWGLFTRAQGPPPPPDQHGAMGNKEPGGNAPIGGGIAILLSMGAAWGGRKVYQAYKKEEYVIGACPPQAELVKPGCFNLSLLES